MSGDWLAIIKFMKKQLLLFVMTLLPMVAKSYDAKIDGFCYNFNTEAKTATVTYYSTNETSNSNFYSGSIQIPPSVVYNNKTYSVTAIGERAFSGCKSITSVAISGNITSIGSYTFSSCSGISSINIPSSVTSIGNGLFAGCTGLVSVTMTSRVTSIPHWMFDGCTNLDSFSIPSSVTSIEDEAFRNCTGLSNITIPTSVTAIKSGAFYNCSNLTSISLPPSIIEIQPEAFKNCTYLKSINIPENVKTIGLYPVYYNTNNKCYAERYDDDGYIQSYQSPFDGCSSLKSFVVDDDNPYYSSVDGVLFNKGGDILYEFPKGKSGGYTIPSQCKAMNPGTLRDCDKLTGLSLSDDFWTPDRQFPFSGKLIKSFHIGKKLTGSIMTYNAVSSLPNVETITVDEENENWWVEDGVLYGDTYEWDYWGDYLRPISKSLVLYPQKKTSTSFAVSEGVKYIATGAMGGNTYVQNVSLPATVGSIGSSAFKDCSNLKAINIPCSYIYSNAFENCSKLTSIDLSNVRYLGGRSFQNCTSLKTIILGSAFSYEEYGDIKYMDHIGDCVFVLCNSISDIYVINKNLTLYGCVDVDEDYDEFVNVNMFYNNFDATVHIPSGCLSAYQSSGQWCNFSSWVEDKSVDVKCAIDDATKIWSKATEGDAEGQYESGAKAELKNVIDEVLEAWSLGLADNVCDNLLQQIIDALATFESKKVTYGVNSTFMATIEEGFELKFKILSIQQPEVTVAPYQEIANNTSVTIPETVQDDNGTTFTVSSISDYAFRNSSTLTSVAIPNSIATIGLMAFRGCSSLTDVYCYAENIPVTSYNAFESSSYNTATLHVPASSINSYQSTAPWKSFGNIVALPLPQCATPTIAFANGRLTFDCETEDVEFFYTINATISESSMGNNVPLANLGATYTVSVYAKKEGYYNSGVATQDITYQAKTGDVNRDGEVNVADHVKLSSIIMDKE